jgi:hypothetical protein
MILPLLPPHLIYGSLARETAMRIFFLRISLMRDRALDNFPKFQIALQDVE